MTDPNNKSLEEIQDDIAYARKWAIEHFNANAVNDTLLDPPAFFVEFPEPDVMRVCPKFYGRSMDIWFTYRLAWIGKNLAWKTRNPLTGAPMSPLVINNAQSI